MEAEICGEGVDLAVGAMVGGTHSGPVRPVALCRNQLMEEESAAELRELLSRGSYGRCSMLLIVATILALGSAVTASAPHEAAICGFVAVVTAIGAAVYLRACLSHLGPLH